MRRALVLSCVLGGAALAAPTPTPGGLPAGADWPADAPRYGEAEFLADSMATIELAVLGTPHGRELRVARVLGGQLAPALTLRPGVVRIFGPRFSERPGLWLLVRGPAGYYAVNSTAGPLPEAAWKTLAPALPALPGQDVVVEQRAELVSIDLGPHMQETLTRQFDVAGHLVLVQRAPRRGPGLWFTVAHGRLRDFSRTLDGQLDGLERNYDDQGRPRSEASWRAGLREGWTREWKDGKLTREDRYQGNLRWPVAHWSGKPGPVVLERHEVHNLYHAPAAVRDRLRVGMTVAQVLALTQVDFSLADGLDFEFRCGEDLHVEFQRGRVSQVAPRLNQTICDP